MSLVSARDITVSDIPRSDGIDTESGRANSVVRIVRILNTEPAAPANPPVALESPLNAPLCRDGQSSLTSADRPPFRPFASHRCRCYFKPSSFLYESLQLAVDDLAEYHN